MWKNRVFVIGVGMTKFEKPGRRKDFDYPDMAKESGTKALKDAGISFKDVEHASVGYCYGDSTCGQRAVYQLGMTGIPIYNVNNNCSTGSTALLIAKQLIEGGLANCVMALGFEKMQSGSLVLENMNRTIPMDKHLQHMADTRGLTESPVAAQMFGNAGREHMERYDMSGMIDTVTKKLKLNGSYVIDNDLYLLDKSFQQTLFLPIVYHFWKLLLQSNWAIKLLLQAGKRCMIENTMNFGNMESHTLLLHVGLYDHHTVFAVFL
ncbi:sterol carrier protein 2-like [Saccoglossus kowalevskii]